MAGFKTHLTFSTLLGTGYAGVAYFMYDVPWPTCLLAGGLCGVSGMLPDIDSHSGQPLRESMAFAAAVVALLSLGKLQQMGLTQELLVLAGAGCYLLVRFGGAELLRRYTVHRGMFHSLPAAAIFGEIAFLLASGDDVWLRAYKAGGVVLGYLSHLLLDELFSLEWHGGRLRTKQSFGTALKLFSRSRWANLSTYVKLAVLTTAVLYEPQWTTFYHNHPADAQQLQQAAAGMLNSILRR